MTKIILTQAVGHVKYKIKKDGECGFTYIRRPQEERN